MRDAQFEVELERQRQEAAGLRARLAQRRRAEAETLGALEASCAHDEREAARAAEEAAADARELAALEARLKALEAGLSRSRSVWVRLIEPWLLSCLLFGGFVSIGLSPKPAATLRHSAVALLAAAAVGLTWGSRRGR